MSAVVVGVPKFWTHRGAEPGAVALKPYTMLCMVLTKSPVVVLRRARADRMGCASATCRTEASHLC